MRMALAHSTVANTGFRVRGRVSSNLSREVAISFHAEPGQACYVIAERAGALALHSMRAGKVPAKYTR
jgi:hypothetical protein